MPDPDFSAIELVADANIFSCEMSDQPASNEIAARYRPVWEGRRGGEEMNWRGAPRRAMRGWGRPPCGWGCRW